MPNTCSACKHPQLREINHRIREQRPLVDIERWLDETDLPITAKALARHAKNHLGQVPAAGGRRPLSTNFLTAVVENAHESLQDGIVRATLRDGIAAQAELNRQMDRSADRDLMVKIAMALTGTVAIEARVIDPELQAIEAEFRPLLTAGD